MAKTVKIHGVTYPSVPYINVPLADDSGDAAFYDTGDNDVTEADVRANKRFTGANGPGVGKMPERGTVTETISTKDQTVQILAGIHSGEGSVQLAEAERNKIVPGNIRAGVTLLGQEGKSTVVDTEIASADKPAAAEQVANGFHCWVNGEYIDGKATPVTVSQDPNTKVLSIS